MENLNKKSLSPYFFALFLGLFGSGYLFLDDRSQSWLISPLIFLPFIWAGFVLTIVYIIIARCFKMPSTLLMVILPIWFVVASIGSMHVAFSIWESHDRNQRTLEMKAESNECLQNFKNEKNLYEISNINIDPIYSKQKKVLGFNLKFSISSPMDEYIGIIPEVVLDSDKEVFGASNSVEPKLKNKSPQEVVFALNKIDFYGKDLLLSQKSGHLNLSIKISIFDEYHKNQNVIFLDHRQYPDVFCETSLANNKKVWPVYSLPQLKIEGYSSADF